MSEAVSYEDFEAFARIAARGFGDWGPPVRIEREAVEMFCRVTGAPEGDGHIPGILLQAMLPRLVPANDWSVTGHRGAINLGCPTLRYPVQAPTEAELRGRSRLIGARQHPKGTLLALEFEVQEVGAEEPCLRSIVELLYLGRAS